MGRSHIRKILFALVAMVLLGIGSAFLITTVNAQNDIASEIRDRLSQKNVPVKVVNIIGRFPLQLEIVIQSASTDKTVTSADPTFTAVATNEVVAARRRGPKIDRVKVTIVNSQGETIAWSDLPVDKAVDTTPVRPSPVDNTTVATTIRNYTAIPGLTYKTLDVVQNQNGAQEVTIIIATQDIPAANTIIPAFMPALGKAIAELRQSQGAQIASVKVDVIDAQGQPLLKYTNSFLPSQTQENWWQAPGVTQDWFPHPPATP